MMERQYKDSGIEWIGRIPQEWDEEVFKKVLDQVENYKKNGTSKLKFTKLANVEDDRDVRNLIYQHLLIAPETSDGDIRVEVMKAYQERYPDMGIIDWIRIIEAYTPMVREAAKQPRASVVEMQQRKYGMAAERENSENLENLTE